MSVEDRMLEDPVYMALLERIDRMERGARTHEVQGPASARHRHPKHWLVRRPKKLALTSDTEDKYTVTWHDTYISVQTEVPYPEKVKWVMRRDVFDSKWRDVFVEAFRLVWNEEVLSLEEIKALWSDETVKALLS